jgi:serine/threonine protein kinase
MAPEVVTGDHNEKSDVWSVGIMLYIMLTECVPFDGDTDAEIFESILHDPLEFPDELWENVDPDAIDLIKHMLDKDMDTRYTMQEALLHPFVTKHSETVEVTAETLS